MKIFVRILVTLILISAVGGMVYFGIQYKNTTAEKETLVKQNGELQSAIDAIGPVVTTWTVKAKVDKGVAIKETDLIEQTTPQSSVTEVTVLDVSTIVGKYYKVDIYPGTSITTDLVSQDDLTNTTYERDMTFDFLPIGIRVGDYIDIRIILPYGEEMVVFPHHRVMQLVIDTNTVKLYLTEAEIALWNSALKDKDLWGAKGLKLYVTKYVEPGVDEAALSFYPVRTDMESFVTLNPNIADKTVCINSELRKEINKKLKAVSDSDSGLLGSGTSKEAADLNSAKESYIASQEEASSSTDTTSTEDKTTVTNPVTSTSNTASDSLDNIGDKVNVSTDPAGNSSSITTKDEEKADGSDAFSDENVIQ